MSINQKIYDQVELLEEQESLICKLEDCMKPFLISELGKEDGVYDKDVKSTESQLSIALQKSNDAIKANNKKIVLLLELLDLDEK